MLVVPKAPSEPPLVRDPTTAGPGAWSVDQVVAWARQARLSGESIRALQENEIDGPTLVTLDKEDLQSELRIRSLAARRYLWDLIESLRSENDASDYIAAIRIHEDEIEELGGNLAMENPDAASGGKKLDTAVLDCLHQDAGRQRQIVEDHLLAFRLQREMAGSQEVYENSEVAREEQHRWEQLRIQSEFDHQFAQSLEGMRERTVPDDQSVRDVWHVSVTDLTGESVVVSDIEDGAIETVPVTTKTIGDLPYIKRCNVCFEETVRGFRLDCPHEYCVGCMRQTLKAVMNDFSLLPFRCCDMPIDLTYSRIVLKKKDADHIMAKAEELEAKEKMYCPSCSKFINLDRVDSDSIVVACACGTWLCVECKTTAHSGLTCRENKAATSGSDELVMQVAREQGWKQCPSCQSMIELVYGCNHMTCANCQHQFCYRCLSAWSVRGGVSLCSSGVCEVWDPDRLLEAAEARVHAEEVRRHAVLPAPARNAQLELAMAGLRHNEACQHQWYRRNGYAGGCERCGFEIWGWR